MDFLTRFIASVSFLGYAPLVPGTFGSAAGLAIFFLTGGELRWTALSCAAALILGFLCAGRAERLFGEKDSRHVVIDEVAGMLIGLLFVPRDPALALLAFLMFRILDTVKPFPAQRIQDLHGSAGIMLDDVFAGLYTLLVMQIIIRFI